MKKVKIIDLPLGARFSFDLAGCVWVLLDKGLCGTCILENCKACSRVNVAETAEAFANMEVFNVMRDAVEVQPHVKDLQEALKDFDAARVKAQKDKQEAQERKIAMAKISLWQSRAGAQTTGWEGRAEAKEDEEEGTIRYTEFDGEKMLPPTFLSGFTKEVIGKPASVFSNTANVRQAQAILYIKSSLDELLKEAENLGVEVKVEGAEPYAVYAK